MEFKLSTEYNAVPSYPQLYDDYKAGVINRDQLKQYAQQRKELDYKNADKERWRSTTLGGARAGISGALMGASFHPLLNIPYVGTGIGGALFELGNSINHRESVLNTLKNTGKGFVIGETVGAMPYAGKFLGRTKAGQAVAESAGKAFNKVMDTPIGQKVGEYGNNLADFLMTDVLPSANKTNHSTNLYDYLRYDSPLTKGYAQNKGFIDTQALRGVRKARMGLSPFEKTESHIAFDSKNPIHRHQADLINEYNPAPDDYHTWVRNADDIHTFEDTLKAPNFDEDFIGNDFDPSYTWDMAQNAIKDGHIDVYSSYPIDKGVFVTPSTMEAQMYAGNGKIYNKRVPLDDVAWIDNTQGQYAPVKDRLEMDVARNRFHKRLEEIRQRKQTNPRQ